MTSVESSPFAKQVLENISSYRLYGDTFFPAIQPPSFNVHQEILENKLDAILNQLLQVTPDEAPDWVSRFNHYEEDLRSPSDIFTYLLSSPLIEPVNIIGHLIQARRFLRLYILKYALEKEKIPLRKINKDIHNTMQYIYEFC